MDFMAADERHGITEPRIWTPPLRTLDKTTSLGYEVIEFASRILHVELYPWQRWLLVHALELNPDGSYRFRRVIVLVARQNGKTTLMGVLAAWWLFVDSKRHPDRIPPFKFLIVGAAQTLDNAKGPYNTVKMWCNPTPETEEERALAVPGLQRNVQTINRTNGEEGITAYNKASYIVRAANNIRSKSAARNIFDELREQHTWDGWNSVSQICKAVWSSQQWGISNAGDYRSVVLWKQVSTGRKLADGWTAYVKSGLQTPDEWAERHDVSYGYFEWSAPDGCAIDDPDAIRQSNPSLGYGPMTIDSIRSDIDGMTEAHFRTEVLCQWVTADITPAIPPKQWAAGIDPDSRIPDGGRVVLGVDTSHDRSTTWIAAAGYRQDGLPHVETIARRDGMLWVLDYLDKVRDKWGIDEVALQSKGCPAFDLADPLEERGWTVHRLEGPKLGGVYGRFLDLVHEGKLRHPPQPAIEQQIQSAITKSLGEVQVWNRKGSAAQISGVVAESEALYALETETGETPPKYRASENISIRFTP